LTTTLVDLEEGSAEAEAEAEEEENGALMVATSWTLLLKSPLFKGNPSRLLVFLLSISSICAV
jgi:hypothetical protein